MCHEAPAPAPGGRRDNWNARADRKPRAQTPWLAGECLRALRTRPAARNGAPADCGARLQVLADGEHVDVVPAQITHAASTIRRRFRRARASGPDFVRYDGTARLERAQQLAASARNRRPAALRYSRGTVSRLWFSTSGGVGGQDVERYVETAAKVGHQHFDACVRRARAHARMQAGNARRRHRAGRRDRRW